MGCGREREREGKKNNHLSRTEREYRRGRRRRVVSLAHRNRNVADRSCTVWGYGIDTQQRNAGGFFLEAVSLWRLGGMNGWYVVVLILGKFFDESVNAVGKIL